MCPLVLIRNNCLGPRNTCVMCSLVLCGNNCLGPLTLTNIGYLNNCTLKPPLLTIYLYKRGCGVQHVGQHTVGHDKHGMDMYLRNFTLKSPLQIYTQATTFRAYLSKIVPILQHQFGSVLPSMIISELQYNTLDSTR
jgi:hypothetical protein